MVIRVFVTGGTIDNLEYSREENLPKRKKTIIPDLLRNARITEKFDAEEICFKDSKFVSDLDREYLCKRCIECDEDRIVITHGTMTMEKTAIFLGKSNIKKTIVLTGAAIPGNKEKSDAMFNLGAAFTAAELLAKGVYICMNGKVFNSDNVRKDLTTGCFVAKR